MVTKLVWCSYHKKCIKITKGKKIFQVEIPLNLKNYENNLCWKMHIIRIKFIYRNLCYYDILFYENMKYTSGDLICLEIPQIACLHK